MINLITFFIVFILLFLVTFFIYFKKSKELILYHHHSLIVDIIACLAGILIIYFGYFFSELSNPNMLIIWIQIIIGIGLFNIHLVRYIIRIMIPQKKI